MKSKIGLDKYYEIDKEVITIKNSEIGISFLDSVKNTIAYKDLYEIERISKSGFIDIKINNRKTDVLKMIEYFNYQFPNSLIELNTYGEYYLTPNDPEIQWHVGKIGLNSTWDNVRGDNCVVIGILDSGTDWLHVDLGFGTDTFSNIFRNDAENDWADPTNPNSGNGLDDNGNGFIDDWIGWDFANNNNDSRNPVNNHGTAVAGVPAAKLNNGVGLSGIAGGNNGGVQVLSIGVGDATPVTAVIDDAIDYAVDNGVRVINMSFGVFQTAAIDAAIQNAINNNVVLIAATGNGNIAAINYPASNPNVIAVGATTVQDTRWSVGRAGSQFGAGLDLVAPGVDIRLLGLNNSYITATGTSFASPMVAGVSALLLSINPNLTVQEIRNIIEETADKISGYTYTLGAGENPTLTWNNQVGYGRLNAFAAVQAILPQINGPTNICNDPVTYNINDLPIGSTVNWAVTDNNLFTVDNSTSINFSTARSPGTSGTASIIAEVAPAAGCSTYDLDNYAVQVGVPNIDITNIKLQPGGFYTPLPENCIYDYNTRYSVQVTGWPVGATSTDWDGMVNNLYKDAWYTASFYPLPNDSYHYGSGYVEFKNSNACGNGPSLVIGYGPCGGFYSYSIYPNPASNELNLVFVEEQNLQSFSKNTETKESAELDISIINHQMEVILTKKGNTGTSMQINTSNLKPGNYIVHINIDGNNHRHHLVIE